MMSVKPAVPLTREMSYLGGRLPKMLVGLQRFPMSGAALINSPHQYASAGLRFARNPPKVRYTLVAPCVLTFTPVGLTRTCAGSAPAPATRKRISHFVRIARIRMPGG